MRCVALLVTLAVAVVDAWQLHAAPRLGGKLVGPSRASRLSMSTFDELTLDEKVAMARVAKNLENRPEDEPGAFAASPPIERPEWANPTNETWAAVRQSYPVLADRSDAFLAAARSDILEDVPAAPAAGDNPGVASGAVPVAFLALAVAGGFFINSQSVNPACNAIADLPAAAQRACAEQVGRTAQ